MRQGSDRKDRVHWLCATYNIITSSVFDVSMFHSYAFRLPSSDRVVMVGISVPYQMYEAWSRLGRNHLVLDSKRMYMAQPSFI